MSRRKLFTALAGAGCFAFGGASSAVEVNEDGIGQVLLYPYYTVRSSSTGNALNTLITLGNTTDHVKAVRVRFREGAVGAPVADLNVYLGAHDMWTGAVVPDTAGGARFVSADRSCTVPSAAYEANFLFSNYSYVGDPLQVSLDRTREGFIEMVEMGDYGVATAAQPGSVAEGVQPVAGTPLDCSRAAGDSGAEAQPGTGGLFGRAILINVGDGTEFSYSATALSSFNLTRALWAAADAPGPTLADVDPPISVRRISNVGTIRTQWTQPIDAVSAVLMHESVSNEYVLDTGTKSITDWVVTMPTKYYYVNAALSPARLFRNPLRTNGACEIVLREDREILFDREGRIRPPDVNGFISLPSDGAQRALCWASTVAAFGVTTLFSSSQPYATTLSSWDPSTAAPAPISGTSLSTGFDHGWMKIALHDAGATRLQTYTFYPGDPAVAALHHYLVGGSTTVFKQDGSSELLAHSTYYGLPVIGFAAESYTNGTLIINGQVVLANYGGLIGHRYLDHVQ